LKVLLLTNEYPPNVYGGAGVHVEYLARELAKEIDVDVRCFGSQKSQSGRLAVSGFGVEEALFHSCPKELKPALTAAYRCVSFNAAGSNANLVHCHTWYTHLGGILAKLNYGIPLVLTTHSLEPLRPWKREQLGGAYDFSCWVERTAAQVADAVIAVSHGTKKDVVQYLGISPEKVKVIHNGIDVDEYKKVESAEVVRKYGVDPGKPYVLFVGRITRQKGIVHLVRAIPQIDPSAQTVLCAGAPDTKEIAEEMKAAVAQVQAARSHVFWIPEMLSKKQIVEFYSHAAVFCCPSIYEPFGIINLEAMACRIPVVASAVGGIPEVVQHEKTGLLVPVDQLATSPFEPRNPAKFSADLAQAINRLLADPKLRDAMAEEGRRSAATVFGWPVIARETLNLYRSITANRT